MRMRGLLSARRSNVSKRNLPKCVRVPHSNESEQRKVHVDGVDCKEQEAIMLLTMSRALKTAAVAALLGVGLAGAGATSASAEIIKTQCFGDDCYRVRCDDWGFDCVRTGYIDRDYDRGYRAYRSRYICDADGEYCHWTRTYDDDYPY